MIDRQFLSIGLLIGCLGLGCAAQTPVEPDPAESPLLVSPAAGSDHVLRQIAIERVKGSDADGYRIGPGDLLEIRVFKLEDMNRTVRVAPDGTIQLPFIGAVDAGDETDASLSQRIADRLRPEYLKRPQVDVFVKEFNSRKVAVTGAVAKPGLYPLRRGHYTLLDMLSEAGGLTKDAGSILEFIPGQKNGGAGGQSIQIDLNDLRSPGNRAALNLPVAGGDVLFVAESGTFTVEGWVDKPGTYPVTRATTILSALAAGGEPLFPARLGQVEILRSTTKGGAREIRRVDAREIRAGRAPDVAIHSGDVVRVPAWPPLVPLWAAFTGVRSLISVGASIPIL